MLPMRTIGCETVPKPPPKRMKIEPPPTRPKASQAVKIEDDPFTGNTACSSSSLDPKVGHVKGLAGTV